MLKELEGKSGKLGAMKLENGTNIISEFCGLAAKMYSIQMEPHTDCNGKEPKSDKKIDYMKGKGVPTRALKANATHQTYKSMIFNPAPNRVTFRTLRSRKHTIEHLEIGRKMLTAYNDKVFAVTPLFCRPLGHFENRAKL